jgi:hypothetical protein
MYATFMEYSVKSGIGEKIAIFPQISKGSRFCQN